MARAFPRAAYSSASPRGAACDSAADLHLSQHGSVRRVQQVLGLHALIFFSAFQKQIVDVGFRRTTDLNSRFFCARFNDKPIKYTRTHLKWCLFAFISLRERLRRNNFLPPSYGVAEEVTGVILDNLLRKLRRLSPQSLRPNLAQFKLAHMSASLEWEGLALPPLRAGPPSR